MVVKSTRGSPVSRSQDGSQALANWRASGLPRAVRAPGVVEGTRRFKGIGAVEHAGIGREHSAGGRGQGELPLPGRGIGGQLLLKRANYGSTQNLPPGAVTEKGA